MKLLAEHAFLRQQLLVAARHVRKPSFRVWDRLIMVMLAAVVTNAVANLVHFDGRDDLVDAVVATHNDLAVADVHGGPLGAWMVESGFTQAELARMQKPAPLVERRPTPQPVVAVTPAPMTEAEMNAAMVVHLGGVEAELRASTAASLAAAVAGYLAAHRS